jgi:L-threonylcarbamoyladenylate synthase
VTLLTVDAAAQALAHGAVVALPTETVYGLAARADDDDAVAQIFRTKGRPSDHPLIVHVADAAAAQHFAADWPPLAQRLCAAFWPGPLTVIVPRRAGVADGAAGGHTTIGLRCPAHPVFAQVLAAARALGVPGLAAPSANRFGRVSPTTAAHVQAEFDGTVPVVDGGECTVGIESTIVDCSRGHPVLLRPGMIDAPALAAAAGEPVLPPDAQAPKAAGTLAAHYAPRARLRLFAAADLAEALAQAAAQAPAGLAVYSRARWAHVAWRWVAMADDPGLTARQLFATLRRLDDEGVREIWVEAPPGDDPRWAGVLDRLQRAAVAHLSV